MTIKVPEGSRAALATRMLNAAGCTIKLYTAMAGVALDDNQTAASFTEASTLSQGYAAIAIPATTSWSAATPTAGLPASAVASAVTWTGNGLGGAISALGYYVVDTTSGALLWYEAFSSAKAITNDGDQIIVTPTLAMSNV